MSHAFYDIFLHCFRLLVHFPLFFDAIYVISSDLSECKVFKFLTYTSSAVVGLHDVLELIRDLFSTGFLVFHHSHTNAFAWIAVNRVEEPLELDLLRRVTNRSTTADLLYSDLGFRIL